MGGVEQISHYLDSCEEYSITSNKWVALPCLHFAGKSLGSVLLKSGKAFCFGGSVSNDPLEIESLQTLNAHGEALGQSRLI